jgi:hypothetical protein
MLKSIGREAVAHKHVIMGALVVTAVAMQFASIALQEAVAQTFFERIIELRCLPYCQTAADVLGDRVIETPAVRISFSFLPFRG